MDQVDQQVAENILREMSSASINLDDLASAVQITKRTLVRRLAEGSFKARELGVIAQAIGCTTASLYPDDAVA
jgi:hypothetical protein